MDTSEKIVVGGAGIAGILIAGKLLLAKSKSDKQQKATPFLSNLFGQQTEQSIANIAQTQITSQQGITANIAELEANYNKLDEDIRRLTLEISQLNSQINQQRSAINSKYEQLISDINTQIIYKGNQITLFTQNLIQLDKDYYKLKYVVGYAQSYANRKSQTNNDLNNARNGYNNLQSQKTSLIDAQAQAIRENVVPLEQHLAADQQILTTRKIAQDEIQKQLVVKK